MTEGQFHNPYFKKPTQTERLVKSDLWAYLGSIILVLGLLIWLTVSRRWLWIDYITITGNSYLTVEQVAQATREALKQPRWYIVPQRFLPITNEVGLAESVRTTLEQTVSLQSIVISSDFPNTLHVTLKEYVPGYVYIDQKKNYYIDRSGIVTTQVVDGDIDPQYPHIRDRNKKRSVNLHDQVVSETFITFIDAIIEKFTPATQLNISEFAIPTVTCQAKEYVAEKIFADEIEGTADSAVKEQKRAILDRLQAKEITVDESLTLLEEVKRGELGESDADGASSENSANQAYIQWEAQYVEAPCDYVAVTHDVIVVTQSGLEVVFDSSLSVDQQLNNLVTVLQTDLNGSTDNVQSIDLRYEDRVYYK